jgi:hypothetical protein
MKVLTSVALEFCTLAGAAQARDWWMLDVGNDRCLPPRALTGAERSPDMFERGVRQTMGIPQVDVKRDDSGNVHYVAINYDGSTLFWFTSVTGCDQFRQAGEASGLIINRNDLK